MPIQKCKPTSPGRRFVEKVVHDHLHKGAPYAPLVEVKKRTGGRNNNGHITTRHVGGGHIAHAGAGLAPGIPGVGVRALHYGLVAEAADRIDVAAVVGAGLQAGAADAAGPSGGMQHERRCQYGFLHHP